MNILENKRVVLLTTVFALAFAGVTYIGYDRSTRFTEAQKKLTAIGEKFQEYNEAELPPTAENNKAIKAAFDDVVRINNTMKAEMDKYASFCYGDGKRLSPVDFQNQVRSTIAEIGNLAADKDCKLAAPAVDLGMASYKNAAATNAEVPFRSFQLKAVQRVAETIINSGAPSLDKIYCAPLPVEATDERKNKATAYFPLSFQVAFNAKRSTDTDGSSEKTLSVLPKVINGLMNDKDYFITITGVAINSDLNLPDMDAYTEPSAPAPQGDDVNAEADEGQPAQPEGRVIAVRKTGSPDETIRVHLNLQVLYFNPAKGK